jgi:fibronectin type 3 domain-containing protein
MDNHLRIDKRILLTLLVFSVGLLVACSPVFDNRPDEIDVSLQGSDKVRVAWSWVPVAVSYEVYRSVETDADFQFASKTINLSYVDQDVESGTEYFYRVRPVLVDGTTGIWSPIGSIILP